MFLYVTLMLIAIAIETCSEGTASDKRILTFVGLVMKVEIVFLMHGMEHVKKTLLFHCNPKYQCSCKKNLSLYPFTNIFYC